MKIFQCGEEQTASINNEYIFQTPENCSRKEEQRSQVKPYKQRPQDVNRNFSLSLQTTAQLVDRINIISFTNMAFSAGAFDLIS